MPLTPHQRAEEDLTVFGLTFPETTAGPAWIPARGLDVKMFCVFGAEGEPLDGPSILMKLPISARWLKSWNSCGLRAAGSSSTIG